MRQAKSSGSAHQNGISSQPQHSDGPEFTNGSLSAAGVVAAACVQQVATGSSIVCDLSQIVRQTYACMLQLFSGLTES